MAKWLQAWRRRLAVKPLADSVNDLETWFQSALGQTILEDEQRHIDESVADLYGFHLLQLSVNRDVDLTRNSSIQHRFSMVPSLKQAPSQNAIHQNRGLISAVTEGEKIPLESESVDVVMLHHTLEFSENPHQLLRETERVVIPRGHVLIVSFNPFSWMGLWKSMARFGGSAQWRHHSLRLGRVVDWLRLLDFEPVKVHHGFYRWPVDHSGVIKKTQWMEKFFCGTKLPFGGYYMILARKDVVGMTPIRPAWKKFKPIESLVGATPFKPVAAGESIRAHKNRTLH